MGKYNLIVNNKNYTIEAEPDTPLLWVIRDYIGLKGTKYGCGISQCGACTVHVNGNPARSCQLPVSSVSETSKITTIEGIGVPELHAVQKAWIEIQVPQCGYCQSGQIMSAVALLNKNAKPSNDDIDAALAGNICRCGTYSRIRQAVHEASFSLRQ